MLVRVGADTCFLLGLTALVVTLMCYPADGLSSRWPHRVAIVLGCLALSSAAARLIGEPEVTVGSEPGTALANPLALEGLAGLGALGAGGRHRAPVVARGHWDVGLALGSLRRRASAGAKPRSTDRLCPVGGVGE